MRFNHTAHIVKAKTKAVEGLDGQKEQLTSLLHKTASALEGGGRLGSMAASYSKRAGEYLESQSSDELVGKLRSAIRQRPEVLVVGCLLGGFALFGRFRQQRARARAAAGG